MTKGLKIRWAVETQDARRHEDAPGTYHSAESANRALARIPASVNMFYRVVKLRITTPGYWQRKARED